MANRPQNPQRPSQQPSRGKAARFGLFSLLLLAALLILPVLAVRAQGWDARWVTAYAGLISLVTYRTYASDKHRARTGNLRIPEAHLHFLELLGGWPGAWIAQRRLRHKCVKGSYQVTFGFIILIHQIAAYDALQDWQFTQTILNRFNQAPMQRPAPPEIRREIRL